MRNDTRKIYNAYLARVAMLSGIHVDDVAKTFSVAPSVQQKLESAMQESSEFMSRINITAVDQMQGEKLGLSLGGPLSGRTNTAKKPRMTRDPSGMNGSRYLCSKTNYDTHLKYGKIDAWAKFPDFQIRIAKMLAKGQALDRMCIGFNGTHVAEDTDLDTYPLLQDLNIGWLQKLRNEAEERVLSKGKAGGGVLIGPGAGSDYKNLDAAVFDVRAGLDPWHRNNPNLVCILGSKLLHDKYFPLLNVSQSPSETLAADIVISQKRVGGLQAVQVPYFPENGVLVTTYDNLSVYWQNGSRRRHIIENPSRDQVEDYQSSNDAYVVEDLGLAAMVENIELTEA